MTSHTPAPFADFIVSRLLKALPGGAGGRAVSETEKAMDGDDWWWADDNAKVLELLALPAIWSARPDAVADVIGFIDAMCDGPLIFRRVAAPRLEIHDEADGRATFLHSLMNISCDLKKGEVALGMRFHDGRTAKNATFGGNYVRFLHGQRMVTVDAEDGIHTVAIDPIDGGVRLSWTSRIEFAGGGWSGRKVHAGELTYRCTILSRSMFVDFEVEFDIAPEAGISDVVLTFGCDNLSHNENQIRYEVLSAASGAHATIARNPGGSKGLTIPLAGARYWSVYQTSHMAGFAAAIHSLPEDASRVSGLNAATGDRGLVWAVSEHRFEGPATGRITARERKIITSGGFYGDIVLYADTLTRQLERSADRGVAVDLSISYDYGAEINAIARCLRTLRTAMPPVPDPGALTASLETSLAVLNAAYDRYFVKPAHHNLSAVFSRSLAYVAFAHAELAGGDEGAAHRDSLREVCDLIMGFERLNTGFDGVAQSGFVMGAEMDGLPYVDCHAACLLALVRATTILDTGDWLEAIDRGLSAFCLDTQVVWDRKVDVVCVDFQDAAGVRHRTETFWNFKAGLCLQLFNALKASETPALREIRERHARRLDTFEMVLRHQIEQSLRSHADGVEILTSMLSAETNSETQPWVALGLTGEA